MLRRLDVRARFPGLPGLLGGPIMPGVGRAPENPENLPGRSKPMRRDLATAAVLAALVALGGMNLSANLAAAEK